MISQSAPHASYDKLDSLEGIEGAAATVVALRLLEMLYLPNVSVSNMANLEVSLTICRGPVPPTITFLHHSALGSAGLSS